MPKMKTRRGLKGRFRLTASGKLKRQHSHCGHILTKKNMKRKRHLRSSEICSPADEKRLKKMMAS